MTNPGDREDGMEATGGGRPSPDQQQVRKERTARSAGAVSMLLLIALAAIGIVIGLASGSLSVDSGIAQTTGLNADWECSWTNDDGVTTDATHCSGLGAEPAGDNGLDPHGSFAFPYSNPFVEKDVGKCVAEILPPVENPAGDLVATVTIGNTYPSYECTITLVILNTGAVPFSIGSYSDDVEPPLELLNDTCIISAAVLQEDEKGTIECTVHVMQEAQQSDQYGFTISACAVPCDSPFGQQLGIFGWGRGAPAALGLRIASETR